MIFAVRTRTRYAVVAGASFLLLRMASVDRATAQESTTVGGYGELHYNQPDGNKDNSPVGASRGTLDFHRFVLYLAHAFREDLSFKSEVEIEHTKIEGGEGGEVAVEQAFLDWHLSSLLGLRAGILLPPVGIINQTHEPPTFNGVERPNVDHFIIPTTWRESGAGFYGTIAEGFSYQAYLVAGMLGKNFSGEEGIYEGKQEALESTPVNPSLTGRLEAVPDPGIRLGGSFFAGNTNGGDAALGSATLKLFAADLRYSVENLSIRAEAAIDMVSDADRINNASRDSSGEMTRFAADQSYGWYAEGAYNIMPWICDRSDAQLSPFIRYERYNTQSEVTGFAANPLYDRKEITLGATFKPTFDTAFKIDYQFLDNAAGQNSRQLNLGIGYSF